MSLMDLLPINYANSTEVNELQNAFDVLLSAAHLDKDDFLAQSQLQSATWGLSMWETAYGIAVDILKSYDDRRSAIMSKMRSTGTTTTDMIKNVAESFSNGLVDILEYPSEYRFEVKFTGTLGIPPNMSDLTVAIDEIKPAHLAYAYVYIYRTHAQLTSYTHTQLAAYQHETLRGGEMNG